ncbi:uncharacterized protein EAE97_008394 [Botrytis byssoidea]|uniref:Uncharacterized protein n=1 Tax=Botrytis byssoidea TaxID=139641 RepID=A0A9P5IEQ4_9HELO|nr:uncharacterized protein EAE97_008394 [Botrytis byssoidea]KAF7934034.1 hypothetical protein EAE97_008394 [Botrytis byssoidea]
MSTSLTTGKTMQFTDSGQDNTKLLVLEQILKVLREASSHLRKQETRLSSVKNGLREDPSWWMESLGDNIQVYSNDGRTPKIQIVDKTDDISSGNSTAVPLKHGIRGAISLPLNVIQIYHTDGIAFDRLGRQGIVEDRVSRLATPSEIDRWKSVVGGAYKVPEHGRLRLTFSTRLLLMLASSDDAQKHIDRIPHEEQLCQRLSGCRTTITDLFDSGQIIRYIIGAPKSNTGSQNINCLDSAPTPCPVGTPNSRPLVGPWRRVIVNQDEYSGIPWSQLKTGKLHSDKDEYCKDFSSGMPRILLESSYSLIALADKVCKQYWTLLELKPMTFNKTISSVMHSDGTPQNALSTFFDYTIIAVSHMIQKWEQILEYFDNLIIEKIAFLDPLKHDNLLVDDETFSRSKRYFWVISTLKELDAVISENIQQVSGLINQRELTTIEGDEVRFLEGSRKHMRGRLGQLEEIAKRLRDKRQEALDLRDGLFNASGVMESRAATRLGENVKLLTFVSIFFLPLSFCMSRSLQIIATVVGLSTYLIVFNLDSLMNFSRALHRRFFIFAISMMKTEASDTTRGKRASIFEKFSVQREIEHKPSDWRLVQYLLYRALGTVGIIGKSTVLFKHIKQRLSRATIASMKEARNPIWRGRAQRFEDAWAEKSMDEPSNWRMCQYILIKGTGFSLIPACLYSSSGDQTIPQPNQGQTITGDLENQQN